MDIMTWASFLLAPITGIVTWVAGRKMQKLEYTDRQIETIKKLQEQNSELLDEVARLQDKIVELSEQISKYRIQLSQLQSTFDIYIKDQDKLKD